MVHTISDYEKIVGKKQISEIEVEDIHCVWKDEFSPMIKEKILKNSKILSQRHEDNIDIIALFKTNRTCSVNYNQPSVVYSCNKPIYSREI